MRFSAKHVEGGVTDARMECFTPWEAELLDQPYFTSDLRGKAAQLYNRLEEELSLDEIKRAHI